jgi:hypothetical protein
MVASVAVRINDDSISDVLPPSATPTTVLCFGAGAVSRRPFNRGSAKRVEDGTNVQAAVDSDRSDG